MPTEKHALVAFGANLPFGEVSPENTIFRAILALKRLKMPILKMSRLFHSPCFPQGAGPDYVNAVGIMTLRHLESASDILACLHKVEAEFGRERVQRWGMRTLDLDLLAVGESIVPDLETYHHWRSLLPEAQQSLAPDQLVLPHPRLQDRAFVLVPLADVAPEWCHPVLGQTVQQMLAALPEQDRAKVLPLLLASNAAEIE